MVSTGSRGVAAQSSPSMNWKREGERDKERGREGERDKEDTRLCFDHSLPVPGHMAIISTRRDHPTSQLTYRFSYLSGVYRHLKKANTPRHLSKDNLPLTVHFDTSHKCLVRYQVLRYKCLVRWGAHTMSQCARLEQFLLVAASSAIRARPVTALFSVECRHGERTTEE